MRAAHIFPYQHGQLLMDEIFAGESFEEGGRDELFSPRNGLVMCSLAEERFDDFLYVIVPLIEDESDPRQIQTWHANVEKRFRIRVEGTNEKAMQVQYSEGQSSTWAELDGQEVGFRTSARPRARYLYYHYCIAMLRRAWHKAEHTTVLRDELGRKYWGTPGPYLRRKLLLAFVEEVGNQELLEGALPEDPADTEEGNDAVLGDLALLSASATLTLGNTPEMEAERIVPEDEEDEEVDESDVDDDDLQG